MQAALATGVDPAAPASFDQVGDGVELEPPEIAIRKSVLAGTHGAPGVDDPEPVAAVEFRHGTQQPVNVRSFPALLIGDDFVICHAVFIHLSFVFP
ncbi:hypothetical protein SDC9_99908 [bioreactor metagenome]|uniref:Uncharacterized protein n=1 Tax=bioreactor metagenome TaxID=1076179 RepID=A0A645AQL4_9ZZZZ